MKKFIAMLLALIMVFSLFACGGKDSGKTDDKQNDTPADNSGADDSKDNSGDGTAEATPHMNEDGSMNLDMISYWDSNYDYASGPSYSICYMAWSASVLYQNASDAVEAWCDRFNLKWQGFKSAEGDSEMFMTALQTQLDQGTDFFVLDPDITIFPAIQEVFANYPDAIFMSHMGCARDGMEGEGIPMGGNLIRPFVGNDYYGGGVLCGEKLYNWLKETHPEAKPEEVGAIFMDLTTSPQLHYRYQGALDKYTELMGSDDNCYSIDLTAYGLSIQAGIDASSPIITTNTDIKYWLIFGLIDDTAQGAATVIDQVDLTDNSCVVAIGGEGLRVQCDAGQFNAYRYAYFTSFFQVVEPIVGMMYAFRRGWCTEDTVFPSWVKTYDHGGEGKSLPYVYVPAMWIGQEDYHKILAWVDLYAGVDYYKYDDVEVSLDDFNPYPEIPEGWIDSTM